MNGIIYYIYHIESGRGYVGKHNKPDPMRRFKGHLKYNQNPIGLALRKYGKETFKVIIIDRGTSNEELYTKEIYWIAKLNTLAPNGYNLSSGGQGCYDSPLEGRILGPRPPRSEEWTKNLSESLKGKEPWNKGIVTPPFRRILSIEDVKFIRDHPEMGIWELATKFGVAYVTIFKVRRRLTFRDE